MSFSSLGLSSAILKALQGYKHSTEIQNRLIPAILGEKDILASSQTGTGKTAGFVLPILEKIIKRKKENSKSYIQALIIVPTRELAKQVAQATTDYSQYLSIKSMVIYGGKPLSVQAKGLSKGVDILIATTGRLVEHLNQKNIDLSGVKYFVIDEADTILDMGFRNEISQIIRELTPQRQNILISATLTGSLKELSQEILTRPLRIEISPLGDTLSNIKQVLYPVDEDKKLELLSFLIGSRNYKQVLVFVRTKVEAKIVEKDLISSGLKTVSIHGDKSSNSRGRALELFKDKKTRVLVATDIASRGLDIKGLDIVISYDIPHITQDYIHRIGRTGRAGRSGLAIILNSPRELIALREVERMLLKSIDIEIIDGYAPKVILNQKGARTKINQKKTKIAGAFGNRKAKKSKKEIKKRRKTTKRDDWIR
ncbi:MAG: DEAD/DEAH box helicase [Sulfurovum sp.]|nr:DEAD/DEAH box helicase [Sulfurovaceae bacterium]